MRLDKYLANNGFGSRSEVKKLIASGKISVDGTVIKDSTYNVGEGSVISGTDAAEGHRVSTEMTYYMMNKPSGVVTAASDATSPVVMELLGNDRRPGLNPVGRLDKDTEGLLIITDDGELNHFLTSPKRNVPKKYFAILDGIPDEEGIARLKEGIRFKEFTSRPALLEISEIDRKAGTSGVFITVTEGKFHEVKRLAAAIGCDVKYLKRTMFAGIELDEGLAPGEYRKMTDAETDMLRRAVTKND
ncbi:MAG: rRNA pseudouridine synthase [Lachnospiraceae bacterium]|nr:rRNA pseudouridine synthase [Lachnospiraceae bacterium]